MKSFIQVLKQNVHSGPTPTPKRVNCDQLEFSTSENLMWMAEYFLLFNTRKGKAAYKPILKLKALGV